MTLELWELVSIIVTSVVGGGVVGIATVGVVLRSIMQSPAAMKFVEGLADSVPKETANKIIDINRQLRPVIGTTLDFVEEAFDGIPADQKGEAH